MKAWIVISCAVALSACASGTEGRIVSVRIAAQAEAEDGSPLGTFETRTGWQVTLERAELALSGVYAFAPEQEPPAMARLSRVLVPVARAHGGHDPLTGKRVRAELIEPVVIDLLREGRQTLAEVSAEAGAIEALAIDIAPPRSAITGELDGFQAWLAGEAERDGVRVRFEGGLRVPDEGATRRVETTVEPHTLDAGDMLVLGVRASAWLDQAELDRLPAAAGDDGAPREITPESQVGRAWFIGARSPAAITMRSIDREDLDD